MHFEHLSRLRQSGCSVASVKGCGGGGGGEGGVGERIRERLLQEPHLLHFASYIYFNYPSCQINDQSELGARFSA